MLYDLIIVGGGPAGVAGAVYAARKRLKTLFITSEFGGQSIVSEKICNWIGSVSISGAELAENLKKHALANAGEDLKIKEGMKVISLKRTAPRTVLENSFSTKTDSGEEFESRTILITAGSSRRKLEAKNADRLEHRGLTYCASCDGPLFADKDVVVVGGGNAGFESASQLLAYCHSVTLLNRTDSFRADVVTVEKISKNPKFKTILNAKILEIQGKDFVEGIIYQDLKNGERRELKAEGIFVEIGQIPNTDFVKDLVPLDEAGKIKIDPWTNKTEILGIWAAGDCTNIPYHQNNIAAGDAIKALEDIYLYLNAK
jgi:alkyl hydroperoxide reductase subunit F